MRHLMLRRARKSTKRRRQSSLRTETLEARIVMDAAALVDDTYSARQNGSERTLNVLANDVFSANYSGERRITSVSYGSKGGRVSVADDGQSLRYTPPADGTGTEVFRYYVDGDHHANVEVSLTAPLRNDHYEHAPNGSPLELDVLANDPFWSGYDGPGKITLVSTTHLGSNVEIADDGQSLIYTPRPGAIGKDAFVYIVDDVYPAEVEIELPDPLPPIRYEYNDLVQKSGTNRLDIMSHANFWPDYHGQRRITGVNLFSGGNIEISDDGREILLTPTDDFTGYASFRYLVDDIYEGWFRAYVNRPVRNDEFEFDINSTNQILDVLTNDTYLYEISLSNYRSADVIERITSVGESSAGGEVSIADDGQSLIYSAPQEFEGTDTFQYVADGKYTVSVTVRLSPPVRDDGGPDSSRVNVREGTENNLLSVLDNDFFGNGYTGDRLITDVSETDQGATISIAIDGRRVIYSPPAGFSGTDYFTYTIDDQYTARVKVRVISLATSDSFGFDTPFPLRSFDLDVIENDLLENYPGAGLITSVSAASGDGAVEVSSDGLHLVYTPAAAGTETFRYTIDGQYEGFVSVSLFNYLRSDWSLVDQNSNGTRILPLDNDESRFDGYRSHDPYEGPKLITALGPTANGGTVTIAADEKSVYYSPATDYLGTDSFTYTVDGTMTETIRVDVIRRVRDDVYRIDADSVRNALEVKLNDPLGSNYKGAGVVTSVSQSSVGATVEITGDGHQIVYTPAAGFTGEDTFFYYLDDQHKATVTVHVGSSVADLLPRYESIEEFRQALLESSVDKYFPTIQPAVADGYVLFNETSTNYNAPAHSETNVQVAGVDEADLIENDGKFLYIVRQGELIIAKAYPTEELEIVSRRDIVGTPIGIYLDGDRISVVSTKSGSKSLIERYDTGPTRRYRVEYERNETHVTIFDLADRFEPRLVEQTMVEGRYLESRRIGDKVFLVVQHGDSFYLPAPTNHLGHQPIILEAESIASVDFSRFDQSTQGLNARERYIERMTRLLEAGAFDSHFPSFESYNDQGELIAEGALHQPGAIFQPIGDNSSGLLSVVSLDMSDDTPGPIDATGIFLGAESEIYGSLDSLYLFDVHRGEEDNDVTDILKFDWNAETGGVDLAARGSVTGRMVDQFSVDEYDGYLRFAATVSHNRGGNWSNASENLLYVLADDGGILEPVSTINNLALHEHIRSVRFEGDKGYLTTYREIDPLFVIDLSNHEQPEVLGHATMPGYNSYTQLIDANHLLTVGKNTVGGRLGPTQVSLFDVSDPLSPRIVEQFTFELNTDSEAELEHHAFGWFGHHDVLAIPTQRREQVWLNTNEDGILDTRHTNVYRELAAFRIDISAERLSGNGIRLLGEIEHGSAVRRSGFIGDVLYSIADDEIIAANINDPSILLGQVSLIAPDMAETTEPDPNEIVYTNPLIAVDVDGSGVVELSDAMNIVARIRHQPHEVLLRTAFSAQATGHYYDTNGDGLMTIADALMVFAEYRYRRMSEGEPPVEASNGLTNDTQADTATTASEPLADQSTAVLDTVMAEYAE